MSPWSIRRPEPVKVRVAVVTPRDQLAGELHIRRKAIRELRHAAGHVPAAAAPDAKPAAVRTDERAEPVELQFVAPAFAGLGAARSGRASVPAAAASASGYGCPI